MLAAISPQPILQFFDANGAPLSGGLLYTYVAGTTTPLTTYTSSAGTSNNTNPVVLNSRGEANVWLGSGQYKFTLKTSTGTLIWTVDNINGVNVNSTGMIIVTDYIPFGTDLTTTNVAPYIALADAAAAAAGKSLYFPDNVYLVSGVTSTTAAAYCLTATAHGWVGESTQAIIRRKDFNTATAGYILWVSGITNFTLQNMTFDGQVTTAGNATPNVDPATIGNYNDTVTEALWSQSFGTAIFNCTNVVVENCVFQNFLRAGIRFNGDGLFSTSTLITSNVRMTDCYVNRTRGIYGDGFYFGGVTDAKIENCHDYDYQRIGFVLEFAQTDGLTDCRDIEISNCTSDLGHDNVAPESNAGFWTECGDNTLLSNCTAKRTAIGFVTNVGSCADTGTTRSWTAPQAYVNCSAIKTQGGLRALYGGTRSVQLTVNELYAESNAATSGNAANAPTYASWVGAGASGVALGFVDTTANVNMVANFKNIKVHCIDRALSLSTSTEFGAFYLLQGNMSTAQQFQLNVDGFETQWSKTDGTDDINAKLLYQTQIRSHYGDIVMGGYQTSGAATDYRFRGIANFQRCNDHTFGYTMAAVECTGTDTVFNISDMPVSLKAGAGQDGNLFVNGCSLFDTRGDIQFTKTQLSDLTYADADSGSKDRTNWSTTMLYMTACQITRQIPLIFTGGTSTNRLLRLMASNCQWYLSFNVESGLKMTQGSGGVYNQILLNGCVFRNNPTGTMTSTKSMIESNFDNTSFVQITGAGSAFDNSMVTGTGHIVQISTAPTYNDTPSTIGAPFLTVVGALVAFGPV